MKKNVVIYTERWCTGGIESLLANLIKNIDNSEFNVNLVVSQKETDIYDNLLEQCNINEILEKKCTNPFKRIFKTIMKFKCKLKYKDIDTIHINIYNGVGLIYAYISRNMGIKNIIVHAHNTGIDNDKLGIKYRLHSICKKLFSKYADFYVACSLEAANFCFNVPVQNKCIIINNGIDTAKFSYNEKIRNEYRKEFDLTDNFVIGNIARFVEQKNHDFLIDVFAELKKMKKNAKLVLVGNGILEKEIINKIKKEKIEKDVIILKERNDIPCVLQMFDVFCFPSKYEGLGIVTIEAQAAGIKCIISDGVPKSVMITPNIKQMSLNEPQKLWAEEIIKESTTKNEKDTKKYLLSNGYDIKENTKQIEELYRKGQKN